MGYNSAKQLLTNLGMSVDENDNENNHFKQDIWYDY